MLLRLPPQFNSVVQKNTGTLLLGLFLKTECHCGLPDCPGSSILPAVTRAEATDVAAVRPSPSVSSVRAESTVRPTHHVPAVPSVLSLPLVAPPALSTATQQPPAPHAPLQTRARSLPLDVRALPARPLPTRAATVPSLSCGTVALKMERVGAHNFNTNPRKWTVAAGMRFQLTQRNLLVVDEQNGRVYEFPIEGVITVLM